MSTGVVVGAPRAGDGRAAQAEAGPVPARFVTTRSHNSRAAGVVLRTAAVSAPPSITHRHPGCPAGGPERRGTPAPRVRAFPCAHPGPGACGKARRASAGGQRRTAPPCGRSCGRSWGQGGVACGGAGHDVWTAAPVAEPAGRRPARPSSTACGEKKPRLRRRYRVCYGRDARARRVRRASGRRRPAQPAAPAHGHGLPRERAHRRAHPRALHLGAGAGVGGADARAAVGAGQAPTPRGRRPRRTGRRAVPPLPGRAVAAGQRALGRQPERPLGVVHAGRPDDPAEHAAAGDARRG